MRAALVLVLCLLAAPRCASAQAPLSPGRSIALARDHYANGQITAARRVLREACSDHPSVVSLRRWQQRLEEEVASPRPAPELRLVREAANFEHVSADVLERALSPANQLQTGAYALYAIGLPMFAAGLGLGVLALVVGSGCVGPCWGGSGGGDTSNVYAGLFLGGAALGVVLSVIASWLDGEADRQADQIRREAFGFRASLLSGGASVGVHGTF